jgi:manganese/zinc/iron transport system permease protein
MERPGMNGSSAVAASLPPWLEFFAFSSVNVLLVLVGCVVLGISTGTLGVFAFLRKRALLGDALAHAALPGVCMAFLLTQTKAPLIILLGAMVSCWLGALSVDFIIKYTRCKEDSALGIVLSVFFGVGILLLTYIRKTGSAAQSGLDKFLFGQAASLVDADVYLLLILGLVICAAVILAYKEFKIVSFDPDLAKAQGLPVRAIEIAIATLIVLAVAIGLQAVGVVLMAAMLVTPAAAARYWTDRLGVMLLLAGAFGAISGALGAYISYLGPRMPTGPWMVMAVSTIFLISLFAAPRRGLLARFVRYRRFRARTNRENILRTLYLLGERYGQWNHFYSSGDLLQHRPMPVPLMARTLAWLKRHGLVRDNERGYVALTDQGVHEAARVTRLHRLWELYLTKKLEIAPDHVHDDAEQVEHILTPELEARLVAMLEHPLEDPHGETIPGVMPLP